MVYLDYAAASMPEDEVLDIFYKTEKEYFSNPNSLHKLGLKAKKKLDFATESIAKNLKVSTDEVIYTSGATEANNLVVKGIAERYKSYGKHIIISALEHTSITASASFLQRYGFDIDILPVNSDGLVDIEILKKMIREDTILVSIVSVDSELGIRQPIEEIGKLLKKYPNTYFHTDASQTIGKVDIDLKDADLITIAPHKFGGINDIGLLIKKKNVELVPIISGGRSTTVYRSGTPHVAGVVALDKTIEIALTDRKRKNKHVENLNKEIKRFLSGYKNVYINSTENSINYVINFSIKGVKSIDFSKMLEDRDIYISVKTSCCPPSTPSKLVYALTKDKSLAATSLRLSLSYRTTEEEIKEFEKVFDICYKELEKSGKV